MAKKNAISGFRNSLIKTTVSRQLARSFLRWADTGVIIPMSIKNQSFPIGSRTVIRRAISPVRFTTLRTTIDMSFDGLLSSIRIA